MSEGRFAGKNGARDGREQGDRQGDRAPACGEGARVAVGARKEARGRPSWPRSRRRAARRKRSSSTSRTPRSVATGVERAARPDRRIDILVNNAGIGGTTPLDGDARSDEAWGTDPGSEPHRACGASAGPLGRSSRRRAHREPLVRHGPFRRRRDGRLLHVQARRHRPDEGACPRARAAEDHGQRRSARAGWTPRWGARESCAWARGQGNRGRGVRVRRADGAPRRGAFDAGEIAGLVVYSRPPKRGTSPGRPS